MPRVNHSRISQNQWDTHKDTIKRLYLTENTNLEGHGGVIELMRQDGLHASKPQYETQFRRWGFRKKLTGEAWHTIGHIIERHDNKGLLSCVYAYGTRLPSEKVKKETARYRLCTAGGQGCTRATLPDGIIIREDSEEIIEPITSLISRGIDSDPVSRSPDLRPSERIERPQRATLAADFHLPSSQFADDADYLITRRACSDWSLMEHYIPVNTTSLFDTLDISLHQVFRPLISSVGNYIISPSSQMRHLLPWKTSHELQRASADIVIVKQIMFLLMNNFAGSDYAAFDIIFEEVKRFSVFQMEDILNAIPDPYTSALQQSILTIAIKSNVPSIVEILLRRGLDANRVTCRFGGKSFTPLDLACIFDRLEVVKILICHGANPNREMHPDGGAAHHLLNLNPSAIEYPPNTCAILQCLLMAHARIDCKLLRRRQFWTNGLLVDVYIRYSEYPIKFKNYDEFKGPFHIALKFCSTEKSTAAIKTMLGRGCDTAHPKYPIYKRTLKETLRFASYQGNSYLVDYILEFGIAPDSGCLCEAVRGNNVGLVQKYVRAGVDIHAISSGNEQMVGELLARGADPNDPGALKAAVVQSMEMVKIILTAFLRRYPTGDKGFFDSTLRKAIREKKEKIIWMLVKHADLNNAGWMKEIRAGEQQYRQYVIPWGTEYLPTLLGEGIATRSVNIVRMLLDSGGDPNSTVEIISKSPPGGRLIAISKAISTGDLDMLKLLHRTGADLHFNATLRIARTSLQLATELGHSDIVQYLLDHSVDVNASPCNFAGGTALQFAAKAGSVGTAELLLQHGADINAPGSRYGGKTAFEFAAEFGRMDMLLLLFHRGVDLVSDGGAQIRRACRFAEENGQVASKSLVMQLAEAKGMNVFPRGGYSNVGVVGLPVREGSNLSFGG
ncbi:Ank-2 multi-domain protein [Pyrenophora teres f. maculata]|nr:Ank-2 multi-domain protein [Pyrenophora teres f. maculata]